jgi:hypothetical protein
MAKTVSQRIPNADGTITVVYSDGSWARANPYDGTIQAQEDDPNPLRAAMFAAGDDSANLTLQNVLSTEDARRYDTTNANAIRALDLRANEISQTYKVNMMNARTSQEQQRATAQYQEATAQLARDRLAFDRETQAQEFGLKRDVFDFNRQTQAQEFGLKQANLGYDLLKTGVDYHQKPADYFNEAEWTRGVAGNPQTSTFLGALQNNTRLPDFQARGSPAEVASLGSLTAKLGGGGTDNSGNYLAQIGNIATKGPQQIGAGGLEQLTPTEQSLFTGGLAKLGYDPSTFLAGYARSRIGQSYGGGSYGAA